MAVFCFGFDIGRAGYWIFKASRADEYLNLLREYVSGLIHGEVGNFLFCIRGKNVAGGKFNFVSPNS